MTCSTRVLNIVSEFGPIHVAKVIDMLVADGVPSVEAALAVAAACDKLSVYTVDVDGYMETI